MKKILLFLISVVFLIPFKVNAEEYYWCDLENFNKIQKLASNITTSYTYTETINDNKGNVVFTVKISNLNRNFYLMKSDTKESYPSMDGELTIENVLPNTKLSFQVIASGYGCDDYIMTIYVTTPPYNPYYLDNACKPYEDYKLCSKWININTSYEDFIKTVSTYPKEKETNESKTNPISFDEIVVQILLFINKYRLQILVPIIIMSLIGIVTIKLLQKKDDFDFKLK